MSDLPPHFAADAPSAGSVCKDGRTVVIEFTAGDESLWVSLPTAALAPLKELCSELDALAVDAKNGVAAKWHVCLSAEVSAE